MCIKKEKDTYCIEEVSVVRACSLYFECHRRGPRLIPAPLTPISVHPTPSGYKIDKELPAISQICSDLH